MKITKVGIIGAGNMGSAFIRGWLEADPSMASRITAADAVPAAVEGLGNRYGVGVAASNAELAEKSDLVLLAVKPNDIEAALEGVAEKFTGGKVLASVAAGRKIAFLESMFPGDVPIIRLMPNVAVGVRAGTICFAAGENVDPETERQALDLFGMLGHVVRIPESSFSAATAISGSGPGFLALITDAFMDAGITAGLNGEQAGELTYSMMQGTTSLLMETDITPNELRRMVTSPAGTTAAGLAQLEKSGVRSAIIDAVQAAVRRAEELS